MGFFEDIKKLFDFLFGKPEKEGDPYIIDLSKESRFPLIPLDNNISPHIIFNCMKRGDLRRIIDGKEMIEINPGGIENDD